MSRKPRSVEQSFCGSEMCQECREDVQPTLTEDFGFYRCLFYLFCLTASVLTIAYFIAKAVTT